MLYGTHTPLIQAKMNRDRKKAATRNPFIFFMLPPMSSGILPDGPEEQKFLTAIRDPLSRREKHPGNPHRDEIHCRHSHRLPYESAELKRKLSRMLIMPGSMKAKANPKIWDARERLLL